MSSLVKKGRLLWTGHAMRSQNSLLRIKYPWEDLSRGGAVKRNVEALGG